MMNAIEVKHVTKSYGQVRALDDVSVSFAFGKIYGLLGRNGAGKSTLIGVIANHIFADRGEVLIDGATARENMAIREKLFCMSERDLYDQDLRVKDHFKWTNRFYDGFDLDRALAYADQFHLDINKRFKALSKGYQSIFKLIIALCLDVPYMIFDEPVLGLDANHRDLFYHLLLENFEKKEKTLILATHLIEEISNIIEEVVLIDNGKILLQESAESLMDRGYSVSGPAKEVERFCEGRNVIGYDELGGLKIAYILGEKIKLPAECNLQAAPLNLQKLFVKMTGKGGVKDE